MFSSSLKEDMEIVYSVLCYTVLNLDLKENRSSFMNEEFEQRWNRKVEFILNQQAQSEAETIKLKAAQAETDKALARAADIVSSFTASILEWCKVLSESQKLTEEALRKLNLRMDRHLNEDHGLES
jgi:hypothetical protein